MANTSTKERLATIEADLQNVKSDIIEIKKDMKSILKISKILEGQKEKIYHNGQSIEHIKDDLEKIETSNINHLWAVIVLAVGIITNFLLFFLRRKM